MLQETWLYDFEAKNILNNLTDSQCFCQSAMNSEDVGRTGRPYGGVAIAWHRSLPITVSPVNVSNTRLCALTVCSAGVKILLICVYMPCDDGTIDSYIKMGDILDEISSIISIYQGYKLYVMGDFNTDTQRVTLNANLLKNFIKCEYLNCSSVDFNLNGKSTFIGPNGKKSVIDHLLYRRDDLSSIKDYRILIEGDNLSDHNPIIVKVEICNVFDICKSSPCTKLVEDCKKPGDTNWSKATEFDIITYKNTLDVMLTNVMLSEEVLQCSSLNCSNAKHYYELVQFSDDLCRVMKGASSISIPKHRNKKVREVPGWNENVKVYKDRSMYWCNIWKEAGCPVNCELDNVRKYARSQYHAAVRYVKKNKEKILKNKVKYDLENKNFHDFWKTIKKMKNCISTYSSVVDGETGVKNITNVFYNKYKSLYNSCKIDKEYNTFFNFLNEKIDTKCSLNKCGFNHEISFELVRNSVNKLKSGKLDPIYEIYSDNVKFGSDLLLEKLTVLCKLILSHGGSSSKINSGIMKPIVKNKNKSLASSDNYRSISLNSLICKLMELILLELLQKLIDTNALQFGFKEQHSTVLCSFALSETIQYYRNHDSNVFALFSDSTKAFDLVKHDKLFDCLIKRNLCSVLVRFIMVMYLDCKCMIQWDGHLSDKFNLSNGVKQGGY